LSQRFFYSIVFVFVLSKTTPSDEYIGKTWLSDVWSNRIFFTNHMKFPWHLWDPYSSSGTLASSTVISQRIWSSLSLKVIDEAYASMLEDSSRYCTVHSSLWLHSKNILVDFLYKCSNATNQLSWSPKVCCDISKMLPRAKPSFFASFGKITHVMQHELPQSVSVWYGTSHFCGSVSHFFGKIKRGNDDKKLQQKRQAKFLQKWL
jgi:hypothetical protein